MVERKRRMVVVLIIAIAAVAGSLFSDFNTSNPTVIKPVQDNSASLNEVKSSNTELAVMALEKLEKKGRAPRTGYEREQFGAGWAEVDGCDMRNYILQRDLENEILASDNCTVLSGVLHDPYTATTIQFKRGAESSKLVQIDHVVALSDAWQKGAQFQDVSKRTEFANDPLNLLAVDGPANNQKSDSDAASWLPPNKEYRCRFVARQIAVKLKYTLWVTEAEHDTMQKVLTSCPGQVLPIVDNS